MPYFESIGFARDSLTEDAPTFCQSILRGHTACRTDLDLLPKQLADIWATHGESWTAAAWDSVLQGQPSPGTIGSEDWPSPGSEAGLRYAGDMQLLSRPSG